MHVFFSGIGGAGIGPLAQIAKQAGMQVSGSDKQDSQYIQYLKDHGINDIHIGQNREAIAAVNARLPIDWFVYSSAVTLENFSSPELEFCKEQGIKISKRDELVKFILEQKGLEMIAIAGTHGKTTTTAMVTWLFKELSEPVSCLLPAKVSFSEMGQYDPKSKYFIYEADEFDRNFLAFEPGFSLITGVSWDHHEIFPTREDYQEAFGEFIAQSQTTLIWREDLDYLGLAGADNIKVLDSATPAIEELKIMGHYNRLDAWVALKATEAITKQPLDRLIEIINRFPGLSRRMEEIVPGLYSDYAHTPEKIRGAMSQAQEISDLNGKKLIVVYEPLTNRRQHYMLDNYGDCFNGAAQVYWLPSYLAREDPNQRLIPPEELISHLSNPAIAKPMGRDQQLKETIEHHLAAGDMVVAMAGGGGDSLDDWVRQEFKV